MTDNSQTLPDELVAQLSKSYMEDQSFLALFKNGPASLDELLIQIYKQSGQIIERKTLNSKIYKFVRKGLIEKTNKKGTFKLTCGGKE